MVKEHSSEASQAIIAAISSTVPKRPIGIFDQITQQHIDYMPSDLVSEITPALAAE